VAGWLELDAPTAGPGLGFEVLHDGSPRIRLRTDHLGDVQAFLEMP
jgi:hypothetical protein